MKDNAVRERSESDSGVMDNALQAQSDTVTRGSKQAEDRDWRPTPGLHDRSTWNTYQILVQRKRESEIGTLQVELEEETGLVYMSGTIHKVQLRRRVRAEQERNG